jgi:predicted transcriptional regulator of viral defense system
MKAAALPRTFTYRQARALGLSKRTLYALRDSGELEVLGRGVYRRTDAELAENELLEIAQRAPHATLCLETALSRHQLSDAIPAFPDVAIPRGQRIPRTHARVRWHLFDPKTFAIGREDLRLDSDCAIGLYTPERCIIDAFRLRGREGHELGAEALRRWLRRRGAQPSALLTLAAKFPRAATPLRRALEVLL